jgi:hypothetical protein
MIILKLFNPPDDEIRWYGEALTNLWFESSVNMSWVWSQCRFYSVHRLLKTEEMVTMVLLNLQMS